MSKPADLPIMLFESATSWASWLKVHHADSAGVWLQIAKQRKGVTSVTYQQAVIVALCYGWIDGQGRALDDASWLQKFTPRRLRSAWSRINRDRAEELIAGGQMKPPGLREVERAKADGRWEAAYEPPSTATVPPDLESALNGNPAAKAFFVTLNSANRYAVLYRARAAGKPETRAARIQKLVEMLAAGRTFH
jgi:uncharacterized protein YdeI (YjbR/CyaY-like superfamily)